MAIKALFVIFHGFSPNNGISKKIHYQVNALTNNGIETQLCYILEKANVKYRMVDDNIIAYYGNGFNSKLYKRLELNSIANYTIQNHINLVYIRSDHNANPFTIHMIRKMKKAGTRVVMEIPTYPYDQEYVSLKMKFQLMIDKCFRKKMARQIDKIITFSNYNTIFGSPTLQISNGIDFNEVPIKQQKNKTSQELHLIGVAEIHFWHGFDRLIKGLANYYNSCPSYKVYFHVVGEFFSQQEQEACIPYISEQHLESYVILHGQQHGKFLDDIFELCDLGVGSLARHRSNITNIKTLKNREYAARGIPFIYSEIDEDFEKMPYIMKIPANESPIDIQQIIDFYNSIDLTPTKIRDSIKHLSWKEQMSKVIESIKI